VVTMTVQTMDGRDTASLPNTLAEAQCHLTELVGAKPRAVVADYGLPLEQDDGTGSRGLGPQSYVNEPKPRATDTGSGAGTRRNSVPMASRELQGDSRPVTSSLTQRTINPQLGKVVGTRKQA